MIEVHFRWQTFIFTCFRSKAEFLSLLWSFYCWLLKFQQVLPTWTFSEIFMTILINRINKHSILSKFYLAFTKNNNRYLFVVSNRQIHCRYRKWENFFRHRFTMTKYISLFWYKLKFYTCAVAEAYAPIVSSICYVFLRAIIIPTKVQKEVQK